VNVGFPGGGVNVGPGFVNVGYPGGGVQVGHPYPGVFPGGGVFVYPGVGAYQPVTIMPPSSATYHYNVNRTPPTIVEGSPAIPQNAPAEGQPIDGRPTNPADALPKPKATAGGTALVLVVLPEADGELSFGDHKTEATGTKRQFETPPLEPGKTYTYKIVAKFNQDGKPVAEERVIEVSAGTSQVVEFTRKVNTIPIPPEEKK
jgi:uncharacterized protein (TIGR03000 family)